jgi:hypothetical protein
MAVVLSFQTRDASYELHRDGTGKQSLVNKTRGTETEVSEYKTPIRSGFPFVAIRASDGAEVKTSCITKVL